VALTLTPIGPGFAAAVDGVDLGAPPDDRVWAALRAALDDHGVLVFRAPGLGDDGHLAVAERFGPVPFEGLASPQQVMAVSNVRPDGILGSDAASFHIDFGFFPEPYWALSLYGLEIPPAGTETWFVSGVVAAATLPRSLRDRLDGLSARAIIDVTSPAGQAGVRLRLGRLDESSPHQLRPALWPHHRTGRPILAVWEQHTDALVPLDPDASTALVEELYVHLYQPAHTYVHRWQPGDLVLWDNHAIQHGRPAVGSAPRTLRRVAIGPAQDLTLFARAREAGLR
jgi:alpha-ketoglutarate-dependent taurine dioxygenase